MTIYQLINNLQDLYGYSESDFDGMTKEEILNYLSEEQKAELKEYAGEGGDK